MDYRFKIEIELDDEKIISEHKYDIEDIYTGIRQTFVGEGISEVGSNGHRLVFSSKKTDNKEFAKFGVAEISLLEAEWFRPYVKKMLWYNSDYGKNHCEDIIKAYEKEGL